MNNYFFDGFEFQHTLDDTIYQIHGDVTIIALPTWHPLSKYCAKILCNNETLGFLTGHIEFTDFSSIFLFNKFSIKDIQSLSNLNTITTWNIDNTIKLNLCINNNNYFKFIINNQNDVSYYDITNIEYNENY